MNWTIKSHKLVHFNPRHKRMRFLKYDSSQDDRDFALYARSASHVVETLDESLKPLRGKITKYFQPEESSKKNPDVITIERPNDVSKELWRAYLDHCLKTAKDEQRTILEEAVKDKIFDDRIELPQSVALDLLDVMPVLSHWDTMGLFAFNRDKVLPKNKNYIEPFFMVMFRYKMPENSKESTSKKILGYEVTMQVGYVDLDLASLDMLDMDFSYTEEKDYFDFCSEPEESELAQYKVYGVLYDAIEKSTVTKAPVREDGDACSYTLIYPITTSLGRKHFWHIQLVPVGANACLQDLAEAWNDLHASLEWPLLKNLVSSELEQLDWSYAQSMILKESAEQGKTPEEQFLAHAMMYIPMKSFSIDNKSRKYERFEENGLLLGEEWRDCTHNPSGTCSSTCAVGSRSLCSEVEHLHAFGNSNPSYYAVLDSSVWTSDIRAIVKTRYKHVIEQQLAVTKQLLGFKEENERKRREEFRLNKSTLLQWIYANPTKVAQLNSLIPSHNLGEIVLNETALPFITNLECCTSYLCPEALGDEDKKAGLLRYFEPSPLVKLSYLLECEPLKGLTHNIDANGDQRLEELKTELAKFKEIYSKEEALNFLDVFAELDFASERPAITEYYNHVCVNIPEGFSVGSRIPLQIKTIINEITKMVCLIEPVSVTVRGMQGTAHESTIRLISALRDIVRTTTSCSSALKKFTPYASANLRLAVPLDKLFQEVFSLGLIVENTGVNKNICIKSNEPPKKCSPELCDQSILLSWNSDVLSNLPNNIKQRVNWFKKLSDFGIRISIKSGVKQWTVSDNAFQVEQLVNTSPRNEIIFEWQHWRLEEN